MRLRWWRRCGMGFRLLRGFQWRERARTLEILLFLILNTLIHLCLEPALDIRFETT